MKRGSKVLTAIITVAACSSLRKKQPAMQMTSDITDVDRHFADIVHANNRDRCESCMAGVSAPHEFRGIAV